jgi:hypothetical protein
MTVRPDHAYGDYYAKWLMLNRQGNHWYSTKDTANALYGLTLYMRKHKELSPDATVTIRVNGKERKSVKFNKENVLSGEGVVFLMGKEIPDGKLEIEIEMKGKGSVYANAFLTYFTKEAKIKGSGNEIFLERTYWRLIEKKKKVKSWKGEVTKLDYDRVQLKEGDEVKSGELIEVKIVVDAKNDYEYLVFEDFKPAGCEPTDLTRTARGSTASFATRRWSTSSTTCPRASRPSPTSFGPRSRGSSRSCRTRATPCTRPGCGPSPTRPTWPSPSRRAARAATAPWPFRPEASFFNRLHRDFQGTSHAPSPEAWAVSPHGPGAGACRILPTSASRARPGARFRESTAAASPKIPRFTR